MLALNSFPHPQPAVAGSQVYAVVTAKSNQSLILPFCFQIILHHLGNSFVFASQFASVPLSWVCVCVHTHACVHLELLKISYDISYGSIFPQHPAKDKGKKTPLPGAPFFCDLKI